MGEGFQPSRKEEMKRPSDPELRLISQKIESLWDPG